MFVLGVQRYCFLSTFKSFGENFLNSFRFDFKFQSLPVEAGCKGTVAFFAGASYLRNKSRGLRLAVVGKTSLLPWEFPAFQFVAGASAFGVSVGPFDVSGLQM